jgi:hypothetical protein
MEGFKPTWKSNTKKRFWPDEGHEPRSGPGIVWAHPPEEIKPEIKVRVGERKW